MLRFVLDLGIFLSIHCFVTFALGLALWQGLFRGPLRARLAGAGPSARIARVLRWGALGLLAIFLAIGIWYQQLDGFAGEVEPLVSSVSWLLQEGEPLYHDLESPDRYSVLYGPSVFLTNGLFLEVLGPSLFSAKVASFLAGLGSVILLIGTLARPGRTTLAVAMGGLAVLFYWSQGFAVYLVRPDALMLFAVALGLFCAVRVRLLLATVAVGVLTGFAINLKIHGLLYFLPAAVLLFRRGGFRTVVSVVVIGTGVTLAPFVLYPQISLVNYLAWLGNAAGHGLDLQEDLGSLRYIGLLLLAPITVGARHPDRRAWLRTQGAVLTATLAAMAGTLVFAAKPGAGVVHFLPFVPIVLYLAGQAAHDITWTFSVGKPSLAAALVPAMALAVLVSGGVHAYRSVKLVHWQVNQAPGLAADVRQIMDTYPDMEIAMACGGENHSFRATWVRPLLVYRDNPLFIDPIAVMDNCLAGRPMPQQTYDDLGRGRVAVWLVPRDAVPFDKENWYPPHQPIFDARFQAAFRSHYTPRAQSRYFDLWFWNGLPVDLSDEPVYALAGDGP